MVARSAKEQLRSRVSVTSYVRVIHDGVREDDDDWEWCENDVMCFSELPFKIIENGKIN